MSSPEADIVAALADVPTDVELEQALRRHPSGAAAALAGDRRDLRAAIGVELDTLGTLITGLRLGYRDGEDVELDVAHKIRDHVQTLITLVGMVRRGRS